MAKPTGAIDAADGGVNISNETHQQIVLFFRHPNADQHFNPQALNRRGPYIKIMRQLTIDAGESAECRQRSYGDPIYDEETTSGATVASWETFDSTDLPEQKNVGTVTMSGEKPRMATVYYGCEASDADTVELLGVGIQCSLYYDYDESDLKPESSADYELFGDNVATWSPFNSNEFASAWLGQTLLATNYNKINYESNQFWSLPV